VIPTATLTDLNDVYLELAIFRCHFVEFPALLDPSLVLAKLVAVDVGDVRELGPPADRAPSIGGLAVELGRAQQVRVGVADVSDGGPAS